MHARLCRFAVSSACCAIAVLAQSGQIQKPGEIQQPKGTWQTPGRIQVAGDIQRIKDRCTTRLSIGSDALFEFNQAEISSAADHTLRELGPMIAKEGRHPIVVAGYTDSVGSAAYNQVLSEKRAQSVALWLTGHQFVSETSMRVQGYGKNNPVAPNLQPDGSDNPEGRQRNRRVEIVIDTCN